MLPPGSLTEPVGDIEGGGDRYGAELCNWGPFPPTSAPSDEFHGVPERGSGDRWRMEGVMEKQCKICLGYQVVDILARAPHVTKKAH